MKVKANGVINNYSEINISFDNGITEVSGAISDNGDTYYGTINNNEGATLYTDRIEINAYGIVKNNGTIEAQELDISPLGSFTNNGTYSGPVNVFPAGLLKGIGIIHGLVTSSGVIAPGQSPGTLGIEGDVVSTSGSTLLVSINPTEASLLDVTGSVTLESGVTLELSPDSGCYSQQIQFDIIHADGGITGTFSQIEIGSLLLLADVSFDSSTATLTITPENLANLNLSGNSAQVAQAVDTLIAEDSGSFCEIVGDLVLSSLDDISFTLNQLQPALFSAFAVVQENNVVKVRDTLTYRIQKELDSINCEYIGKDAQNTKIKPVCDGEVKPFHVWASGMGDAMHQKGVGEFIGYQNNMAGAVLGVDYHFAKRVYAGLLGAYTDSDIRWSDDQGSGHIQSAYTGAYFSALGKMFYGNASLIGSWNHYSANRNIQLPSEQRTAYNKHGGAQLLAHVDTGVNLGWKWFSIRPFDSFDYITQTENGFTENGAEDLDLSVKRNNAIMLRNELGLNFSGCFCVGSSKWTISPKISWVREVRTKGAVYRANFVDTDASFTVTGYFPDRSLVSPGISVMGSMRDDLLTLGLYYNGEFKGSYSDHSYGGQLRFGF